MARELQKAVLKFWQRVRGCVCLSYVRCLSAQLLLWSD